jgi:hypothetical protein
MSVPHPGYTSAKPLIEPITLMYKELGDQDACVQLQELSVRHLERCAADMGESVRDFLRDLYEVNSIPHGSHSFEQMRAVASTSYLLVTYALFEKMLKGCIRAYRSRYPAVEGTWSEKDAGEQLAPLQKLVFNALPQHKQLLVAPPEYKLLEYYRVVRVAGAHVDEKTVEKAAKAFRALSSEDLQHFRTYSQITVAPNAPNDVSFEDFRLYTRSIKYYSNILNDVCG